ncbi:MAG: IS3 family transposase [Pseudomonadota bacterium]
MKRKRYSEEQIISILKQHEAGRTMVDLAREHGIAENTLYRWKSKFGGMEVSEAKRLRDLESENARLKRLLAEAELDKAAMKEVIEGKVVTARQRRRAVEHLKSRNVSERRTCRVIGFSRSAVWRKLQGRDDADLRHELKALAERYPRYGCPTLHDMLRAEGLVLNHKRTHRIYCEEGLQVRTKKRKKLTRPRIPLPVPDRINERWSVDFVSDQLANGRRFRVFNVVDDFSRECLLQVVDFSISGQRLTRELDHLSEQRGLPVRIVMDNGPELTSKAMFFWSKRTKVKLHFIQPGKPTQNAFVESFNGKFRDYCLDLHWFASLADAKEEIESWRNHYNHVRPHRSLGKKPPAVFAREAA